MKHKEYIMLFIILSGILAFSFLAPDSSFAQHAATIIETCAEEEYRPACYDREIPKLIDVGLSMEDAFAITRLVQEKDDSYFYCHVLGHNLSAKETAKDPSKWKEVITRAPSGMCSNGGIHGAFQERFRTEALPDASIAELEPILTDVCARRDSWNPTRLEQATCTHAVGHLAMYVTAGDIQKSLALCERTAFREGGYDFTQICFDGVFMQLFQPLEPEDFTLVEGKEQTLKTIDSFCGQFEKEQFASCRSESWPLYGDNMGTKETFDAICSPIQKQALQERCYSGMFFIMASQFALDTQKIESFCGTFSDELRNVCFANGAARIIETDWSKIPDAVSLCTAAKKHDAEEACYKELVIYSDYNFHPKSKEFYSLCQNLPEYWKEKCLSKN